MHVLFVHQNYPAQFGHIAEYLSRHHGYRCTFVSEKEAGRDHNVERIQYRRESGATEKNHYCSRTFENTIWHAHAVFKALKARPDIRPDLIVGHSGFGSTLFLRELYEKTPIINYFEYFYHVKESDLDFRPDFPSTELSRLRSRARNAMLLLDLNNCDAGYSPTRWQRDRLPAHYHEKVRAIFDGIDMTVWKPNPEASDPSAPRRLGNLTFPPGTRVVSYATRGMESMRGFDLFMKVANRIARQRPDVQFVVAGQDRVCYGGDAAVTGGKTFKQWVLSQDTYDLSRFHFVGLLPPAQLAHLFTMTDLHLYWTVPFVLSWSLMNALACGATVLASGTAPVREMIQHDQNGLLANFFDVEDFTAQALGVLEDPAAYRRLGAAGTELVRSRYSLDVCLPQMLTLYEEVTQKGTTAR